MHRQVGVVALGSILADVYFRALSLSIPESLLESFLKIVLVERYVGNDF